MSFSVNTNAGAASALQNLSSSNALLDQTQSRINTGLKVSSAKDDAASYAIAQTLRGNIAGYNAVKNSLDRAQSTLDVAIAGAEAISDLLIEMKEKAVSAKDDGLDTASRSSLNSDFVQLRSQIDSIVNNATFNGKNLLTGDTVSAITDSTGSSTITASATSLTTSSLGLASSNLVGGAETTTTAAFISAGATINTYIYSITAQEQQDWSQALDNEGWYTGNYAGQFIDGTNGFASVASFSGPNAASGQAILSDDLPVNPTFNEWKTSQQLELSYDSTNDQYFIAGGNYETALAGGGGADAAVDSVETALNTVNDVLSNLGATANQVALQQQFTSKLSDSVNIGIGNLVDADMAKEAANLQASQTRQQLGLQALSLANQAPSTVLSLFR